MNPTDIARIQQDAVTNLKNIYDPEIPVNIYDLGLVYEVKVDEEARIHVLMTLTAPNCPVAESLPLEVKEKLSMITGVTDAEVEITFDPPWDRSMISEAALLELGLL